MLRVPGSVLGLAVMCLLTTGVLLMSPAASADTIAPGGSVTITATISPVRIIVVNSSGAILEILSNGPSDVTPSVYRDSFNTKPIALTPAVYNRYAAIIRHTDLRKTGVIYKYKPVKNSQSSRNVQELIGASGYQRFAPRFITGQRTGKTDQLAMRR